MANKNLLKKIGLGVIGCIIVFGVMLFVFRDNTQPDTVPTYNDFSVVQEVEQDTPNSVGLYEEEAKFNEVDMTTESEVTTETEPETVIEESDHLPGITDVEEVEPTEVETESIEETTTESEPQVNVTEITEPETVEKVSEREIIAVDKTMYAQKDCNVRADAGTDNEKVGSLGKNEEVKVTGETKTEDGSTWYEIDLGNGEKGYVSGSLVGDNKVEESSVHNNSGSTSNQGSEVTNTDSGVVASQQQYYDQLAAMGIKNMGSGIGLTTNCGGSGNME